MAKQKTSGDAIVLLFTEDHIVPKDFLVAWNRNFQHLAIKGKGVILKTRLDTIRKGGDGCDRM